MESLLEGMLEFIRLGSKKSHSQDLNFEDFRLNGQESPKPPTSHKGQKGSKAPKPCGTLRLLEGIHYRPLEIGHTTCCASSGRHLCFRLQVWGAGFLGDCGCVGCEDCNVRAREAKADFWLQAWVFWISGDDRVEQL